MLSCQRSDFNNRFFVLGKTSVQHVDTFCDPVSDGSASQSRRDFILDSVIVGYRPVCTDTLLQWLSHSAASGQGRDPRQVNTVGTEPLTSTGASGGMCRRPVRPASTPAGAGQPSPMRLCPAHRPVRRAVPRPDHPLRRSMGPFGRRRERAGPQHVHDGPADHGQQSQRRDMGVSDDNETQKILVFDEDIVKHSFRGLRSTRVSNQGARLARGFRVRKDAHASALVPPVAQRRAQGRPYRAWLSGRAVTPTGGRLPEPVFSQAPPCIQQHGYDIQETRYNCRGHCRPRPESNTRTLSWRSRPETREATCGPTPHITPGRPPTTPHIPPRADHRRRAVRGWRGHSPR